MRMNKLIIERLQKLRTKMQMLGASACLIPTADYHDSEYVGDFFKVREYFSGFTGSNGTLLVLEKEAGLWTDGRYFIQAEQELAGTGITLFRMQEEGVPEIPDFLKEHLQPGERLMVDGRTITASYGEKLRKKLPGIELLTDTDPAEGIWLDRPAFPAAKIWVVPEDITGQTPAEKLAAVREKMQEQNTQAHFLSRLEDIMWLLNIRGGDIACTPVALSFLLLTQTDCVLFVQKKAVTAELSEHAERWNIAIRDYDEVDAFLREYAFPKECRLLIDKHSVNDSLFSLLQGKQDITIVPGENPTALLKAVKNPTELAQIREVYLQDSVAVTKFIYWLKKTVENSKFQAEYNSSVETEQDNEEAAHSNLQETGNESTKESRKCNLNECDAADKLDSLRRAIPGFIDLSFPTISAYGANAAMMHYEAKPGACAEILPEGMLLVDSGGQYMGGTTDVTRTILLGPVSAEVKKHFTAVAVGMLRLANAHFLQGCPGRNLDILAREPLWQQGIDYKCGTGHGIGYMLNVHEGPQSIRWRPSVTEPEPALLPGMLLSDEPGVYRAGQYGIRTENILAVQEDQQTEDGHFLSFEMLTWVPIDIEGIDSSVMAPEDIENFNRYQRQVYEKIAPFLTKDEAEWLRDATRPV